MGNQFYDEIAPKQQEKNKETHVLCVMDIELEKRTSLNQP